MRTKIFIVCVCAAVVFDAAAPRGREEESYLLPGVALYEIKPEVGAWCRYLVVDEAMGELDSTAVYVAIPGKAQTDRGEAFWIEVESGPAGTPSDREVVKALVSARIMDLAFGDSLCRYVEKIYIRRGTGPVELADPASLDRFSLKHPTSDSTWTLSGNVTVTTPVGEFVCERKHLYVEDNREIPMGRVKLVKKDKDIYDLWTSKEVPIFNLVECIIERTRDSKTIPAIPGIPNTGPKTSRTTVRLTDCGRGAGSLVPTN